MEQSKTSVFQQLRTRPNFPFFDTTIMKYLVIIDSKIIRFYNNGLEKGFLIPFFHLTI